MCPATPPAPDRYQTIVALLRDIVQRLESLERTVDQLDRAARPYGDGCVLRPRA